MNFGGKEEIVSQQQSEDRFRLFFDGAADALFLHDLDGRYVEVNQAACDSLGYTREELLQQNVLDIEVGMTSAAISQIRATILRGEKISAEGRNRRKDGTEFPVEVHLSPFEYEGRPHILASARDISERHRAEEALHTSESFLNSIIDQSPYPMWISDDQGTLIRLNQACLDLLHITLEEVVGKYNVFQDNILEQQEIFPLLQRVFEKGETVRFEIAYDTSLLRTLQVGTTASVILDITVFPIIDTKGKITNAVFQHVDITHRKRAEAALAESEQRFSTFMAHLPAAVFIKDQAGRLVFANRYLREIFGWEDCVGKTTEELLSSELARGMAAADRQVLTSGPMVIQERITDIHGVEHDFDTYKFPVKADGDPVLLGGIAVNVTERKRVVEALELSERKYRSFYESILDGFASVDLDGNIVETNHAYLEMIGYTAEEIRGLRYQDITPSKWHKLEADIIEQQVLTRGYSDTYEKEYIRKDGAVFPVELRTYLSKDKAGAATGMWAFVRDITARKRAEEALKKEKLFTEAILDSLPGTFFLFDSQGKHLRTNASGQVLSGYSFEELPNMHALDFIAEEDQPAVQRAMEEILEKGESSVEAQQLSKDGRKTPFLFNAKKFIIDGLPYILGTGMDITQIKQTEEALRESERKYRSLYQEFQGILEAIPDSLSLLSPDLKIVWANWVVTADKNLQMSDYIGQFCYQARHGRSVPCEPCAVQECLATGKPTSGESTLPDGRIWELRAFPLFDDQGEVKGVIELARGITERKRMEEALSQSEARFRQVVESSPLPIGIAADSGMIEYVNPKFVETFGYTPEDIPHLEDWYRRAYPDPHYRQQNIENWRTALEQAVRGSRPTAIIEVEVACKDGSKKIVDIFGTLIGKKTLGVFNDVTERKRAQEEQARLEAQMREVQKLESLGVLAGGIAHDFNNLLMAILGNADLALLSLSPASAARPNVEEIARASQRAADLCRQMLAYSGKGRFMVGRYDLSEIVQEMAQMLQVTVSKKAALRYSFATVLPAVEVDATQMRQVIMNLITNASEALGDESGFVSVATGEMECDRDYLSESHLDDRLPEGRYVFLEVADTGCGMDDETRRRIFDPFFTTKFTGRGLGLAAVLGIVRGHGGAIKVRSEPGQGTTFTILLPAKDWEPGDRVLTGTLVSPPRRQGTVLLIDDDPRVRGVAGQMLKRLGFKTLTAAQGQEGLEIFQARGGEIDCVLLDLTMPGMGGEEAFRELRRLQPGVRVILSSGYDEQDATKQFAGQGLGGFIQKPYTLAKLQEVLNRVLG